MGFIRNVCPVACLGLVTSAFTQSVLDARLTVDTVRSGLSQPTSFVFIGPNDMLVLEKATGIVRRVTNGAFGTMALDLAVNSNSERGLLGIALDLDFPTINKVFLYYSKSTTAADTATTGTWQDNRVESFIWNGTTLTAPTTLIKFLPSGMGNGPNHDGGILLTGPDGKLYGVTGDLNRNGLEQNFESASVSGVGGIFRLNKDGTVPGGNPFEGDSRPEFKRLYAYGVRNSFGMTFDSKTGALWDTENGENNYDEVNRVDPGLNSGWEDIMGPQARDGSPLSGLYMIPNAFYSDPEFSWVATIAPTGLAFLHSAQFPSDIRDDLVLGDNNLGFLYLFHVNANRDGFVLSGGVADLVADSAAERDLNKWGSGFGVVTGVQIGPDGNLYVCSLGNGAIYRIRPVTQPATLSGKVTLDLFFAPPTGTPMTIELKNGMTVVESVDTTIGALGEYYVSLTSAPGTYKLVAKCSHWLAEKVDNFNHTGSTDSQDWSMNTNGDISINNQIDIDDLNKVFTDFTTPDGDMDGDNVTGLPELNMVLIGFSMVGAS